MLMQYEKLRFRLKQSESEQQQQPLPEDLSLIDKNISDLKETVDRLKNSLEYRFNHLRSLQIELGTYKIKMNWNSFIYYF